MSVPNFREAFNTKEFDLRVHGQDGTVERTTQFGERLGTHTRMVVTPDGALGLIPDQYGEAIVGIDLQTGSDTVLPVSGFVGNYLALSADGRRLAVSAHQSVLVRDIVDRAWIADLVHPSELYAARPVQSADGAWVGALCQKDGPTLGGRPTYTQEVVLWNVREAVARAAKASPKNP